MSKFQKRLYLLSMIKLIHEFENTIILPNHKIRVDFRYSDFDKDAKFEGDDRTVAIHLTVNISDINDNIIYRTAFTKLTPHKLEVLQSMTLKEQIKFIERTDKLLYYCPYLGASYADIKSSRNSIIYEGFSTADPDQNVITEIEDYAKEQYSKYNSHKESGKFKL